MATQTSNIARFTTIEVGQIADCIRASGILLVYVDEISGENVQAYTEHGQKRHKLKQSWLSNAAPSGVAKSAELADKQMAIQKALEKRLSNMEEIELPTLWEFSLELDQPKDGITMDRLGDLWFGSECNINQISALTRVLHGDSIFFVSRRLGFLPRSREEVEREQQRQLGEKLQAERVETFANWLKSDTLTPLDTNFTSLADQLKHHFCHPIEKPARDVRDLLRYLKINPLAESKLYQLLRKKEIIPPWFNFHRLRYNLPGSHSEELLEVAETLSPLDTFHGQDLTNLPTITIDDTTTISYDDAFSIQKTASGYNVLVHIAHPPAFLPYDSPLVTDAKRRGTSYFFPMEKQEMFPDSLSLDLFSLNANQTRPAITVKVEFSPQFVITSTQIFASTIRVTDNLGYDQVDQGQTGSLTAEDYAVVLAFTNHCRSLREAEGALLFNRIETDIQWSGERLAITSLPRSESRQVIEELMILANSSFADFFTSQGAAAIYRGQKTPENGVIIDPDLPEVVREHRLKRQLTGSETGLKPIKHHSLGLTGYVQATSPIRRFGDLILHFQLRRLLQNTSPFSDEEMESEYFCSLTGSREASKAERERRKFLLLNYMLQEMGSPLDAIIIEKKPKIKVLMLETGHVSDCNGLTPTNCELGMHISVKVTFVDVFQGTLKVSV